MNRLLIVHKGEGKKADKGLRQPPSYRTAGQVTGLVRYALAPARQSSEKERVVGIVDGMGLGLEEGEYLSPSMASFICKQLTEDVPGDRRLIRHLIVALASKLPIAEQIKILRNACHRYVARYAPGCSFVAIFHDDHNGEEDRGLHAHLIIRNCDYTGRAIDWSRDDLREQQGMGWAAGLDVVPTRGTGIKRERGVRIPYPKAEQLDAQMIGKLSNEQLEQLIVSGRLVVGRRNRDGMLTSIELDGKRVRIRTARALAARERGMVDPGAARRKQIGTATRDNIVAGVAAKPPRSSAKQPAGWLGHNRPFGFDFGFRRGPVAGRHRGKNKRGSSALRSVNHRMKATLSAVDKIGRIQ